MADSGASKSFALKRRVARLLAQSQDPARVLAVTFTRNAAARLVRDFADLNVENCESAQTGILHLYCLSLLNKGNVFESLKDHDEGVKP